MSTEKQVGQVITFYSYKGGTGRSMALANIGYLLANDQPKSKILLIDWDLEAPGLHYYFRNLLSNDSDQQLGLIDLFLELKENKEIPFIDDPDPDPYQGQKENEAQVMLQKIELTPFMMQIDTHPNLYLIKAGKSDERYSTHVNIFDWEHLYKRSPWLFRSLAKRLTEQFRYVLIDSRTGLTDTSNICTMLMPEKLVVVFTPNRQSLTGIKDLVERATTYRNQSDDPRPLIVFPLPSRIDPTGTRDSNLEVTWRAGDDKENIEGYQPMFEELLKNTYGLPICDLQLYFNQVKIPHNADFSYGEQITALNEKKLEGDPNTLTERYREFMKWLLKSIDTNDLQLIWRELPSGILDVTSFDVFPSYNSKDSNEVTTIIKKLKAKGVNIWLDSEQITVGKSFIAQLEEMLQRAKVGIIFIGNAELGSWQMQETNVLFTKFKEGKGLVISVLLPSFTKFPGNLLFLRDLPRVQFQTIDDENALNQLVTMISSPVEPKTPPPSTAARFDEPQQNGENKPMKKMPVTEENLYDVLTNEFTNAQFDIFCVSKLKIINFKTLIKGKNLQERAISLMTYCAEESKTDDLIKQINIMKRPT